MGILVVGAEKVEEKVGRLKTNLRILADKAIDRTDGRMWQRLRNDIQPLTAKMQRLGLVQQLERRTRPVLHKTQFRGIRLLNRIIEGTIQKLEKLNRRLERDINYQRYAA